MNANIAALLYLVAGVLFIQALRGLSSPESSRRGNMLGIIGMAIAVGTTLAAHPPAGAGAWILVDRRPRPRRRHRRGDRAPRADDLDAGTGRGLPLAGRHGGGAGGGGAFYAPTAFGIGTDGHIHTAEPDRNVDRRRHRRHHLHRLGDRVPQAVAAA